MIESTDRTANVRLEPAALAERFAALAIDASLFVLIFGIGAAVQMLALYRYQATLGPGNFPQWPITFSTVWNLGLTLLTATEIVPGRSVGKKLLRLQILGRDGGRAQFGALGVRWAVKYSPLLAWWICVYAPLGTYGLEIFVVCVIAGLVGYGLVFMPSHQALHDRIARTSVWRSVWAGRSFEVIPRATVHS